MDGSQHVGFVSRPDSGSFQCRVARIGAAEWFIKPSRDQTTKMSTHSLPGLERLRLHEEQEDDVAGALQSVLLDPSQLTPAMPQLITTQINNLYKSFYPELSCERKEPTVIKATSELWGTKRLNVSHAMDLWNHIDGQDEILDFFKDAAKSRAGTLAHVVLTRKKASGKTYETCIDDHGVDRCQHGHLSVVFEHVYASNTMQDVVSVGFFPTVGNAWNLVPGFPDDGLVQIPDPMVSNWRIKLAHVRGDDEDARIQDYVTVLNTFVYSPENMKQWVAILDDHYYDTMEYDTAPDMFTIQGLEYSMYGGISPLSSLSSLTGSLLQLERTLEEVEKKLPIVGKKHLDLLPMNCATYVLAAFPEANLTCRLGVPILCSKEDAEGHRFDDLGSGVKEMAEDSLKFVKQLDGRVYNWIKSFG